LLVYGEATAGLVGCEDSRLHDQWFKAMDADRPRVALAHDYLTQRGGAERVVLSMLKAFPGAPLHTSFYEQAGTFPAFRSADVRVMGLNRVRLFRRNHRLALPLLAHSFSSLELDADLVLCSSSGWAHAVHSTGRKLVYCHSPARWLYQPGRYLPVGATLGRAVLGPLSAPLKRWDRSAAASADRYIANSHSVRDQIRDVYGLDAVVLPAPVTIDVDGSQSPIAGMEPGFLLCVSRLLPYKNVAAVIEAFHRLPGMRLVVVGTGPIEKALRAAAPSNVRLIGAVSDDRLRWLYANCSAVVAASFEDFGLTPLEGAAFGKPAVALRWGGFLDTVVEGTTGLFFDAPEPGQIAGAITACGSERWGTDVLVRHAEQFSEQRFVSRLRELVADELDETDGRPVLDRAAEG
jgi:glycosyltransferase involved in cell wall biosynthesis